MKEYDLLVVGAGIFGLTIAERAATVLNKKVLVIDKRSHIGGNSYSEFDPETGIECHKYGAHIFHTSDKEVWEYVNQFDDFTNYEHRVYTVHKNEVFPLPINLGTINQFFRANYSAEQAKMLIKEQAKKAPDNPSNLKEQGISLIGKPLFEAFIMNYTAKQWQTPPEKLDKSIINRLPVRFNYNNRYFSNTYEGLPKSGYGNFFNKMVSSVKNSVDIRLNTNFFEDKAIKKLVKHGIPVVYTGPIDEYYGYKYGALNWRSIRFEKEILPVDDFQGCPVMNYADLDPNFTRIIEFKHFHPERNTGSYSEGSNKTIIFKEYSNTWQPGKEPYYPVKTPEDLEKLQKYNALAAKESNIIFGGRLGEYAYYDMDATFKSALDTFNKKLIHLFKTS